MEADGTTSILDGLNPEQRDAAQHGDGPLLVVAGAGTGKTTTLAHRVAWLVAEGVEPSRILLLTFTRRAAEEMLRRTDALLARVERRYRSSEKVWGGTFHAVAARLLRLHGRAVGLDPSFGVLDRGDAEDLMGVVRGTLGLGSASKRFPQKGTCLDIYGRCLDSRKPLDEVLRESYPWCRDAADGLRELFTAYTDRKQALGLLDYDDLLLFWRALLASPEGDAVRERFDRMLVDEYQDTNALQAEIVDLLAPGGRGVTVVGDDAQAIYSFRAATVRNILDFPATHPGTHVVTLTRNYRSHQPLLEATNAVIALAAERHAKDLWSERTEGGRPSVVGCSDEAEQTDFVVSRVLELRESGLDLRRQAVLFRASHHSLDLELELARRNVPFRKYGGLRFAETAHVKDLLSVLRLAENPHDELAGSRLLDLVPGIGPQRARRLLADLRDAGGDFAVWERFDPPAEANGTWTELVATVRALTAAPAGDVPAQVHRARCLLGPLVERRYDEPAARLRDLEQLELVSSRFESRTRFLTEIALDPPSWTEDLAGPPLLDEDWLTLSTMHSAKGLEWDAVYVLHASDGNVPADMACGSPEQIEEERRLFYVACSRAKEHLYVCHPRKYYTVPRNPFDTHGYSQLTRFLPERVRAAFACEEARTSLPEREEPDGGAVAGSITPADIREQVKAAWSA
ncbi:MAG: ATP-dependent helicase [Actinobacteria bacterium]|nr:MAG: ATP-dependent helicase [Actinomycetota bacterium]